MRNSAEILTEVRDRAFVGTVSALDALKSEIAAIPDDATLIAAHPATNFILTWMGDHFRGLKRLDSLGGREKSPSSGDEFTLAVAATLNSVFKAMEVQAVVKSEKSIIRRRPGMRPDISIWDQKDDLVAFVECKTNPGYNRKGWAKQYQERTARARTVYPDVDSYLCVLTATNWNSEEYRRSPLRNESWFCLSEPWPTELRPPFQDQVLDPIEPMLTQILSRF